MEVQQVFSKFFVFRGRVFIIFFPGDLEYPTHHAERQTLPKKFPQSPHEGTSQVHGSEPKKLETF